MKFLFVNPPLDLSPDFIDYPYFVNLGIYHNAAVLRHAGHGVKVADAFALPSSSARQENGRILLGSPVETLLERVREIGPHADWAILQNSPFLGADKENPLLAQILQSLRRLFPSARIALADLYFGGMHYVEYDSERVRSIYPELDCVLRYEAESKWAFLDPRGRLSTSVLEQPAATNLEPLPLPAWDLGETHRYFEFLRRTFDELDLKPGFPIRGRTLPIMTTRGCVYRCVFCSSHPGALTRNSYRTHPLSYVADLLDDLTGKFGVEKVVVLDGMVNLDTDRFSALLDLLNCRGLRYEFPNGMRADRLTREQVAAMKGRITTLSISAESGCQEVLDRVVMKKQELGCVDRVAQWCRELKVPLVIHYVVGLPGERVRDMNQTMRHAMWMAREYDARPSLQYAVPLPGTPLAAVARERGLMMGDSIDHDYFKHFTRAPALSTGPCTREQVREMKELFESRSVQGPPRKIILNVSYRCNNRCVFCAVGDRPRRDGAFHLHRQVLEEAQAEGIKLLDLDGGEPTLYPQFLELVRTARHLGFEKVNVTSNGRRLAYEHFARALLDSGLTGLLISLHGPSEEVHERLTRAPGSFGQTVAGIKNVLRLRTESFDFGVNVTLTRENLPCTEDVLEFVSALGLRRVTLQLVTPFGRANGAVIPAAAQVRAFVAPALERFGSHMDLAVINTPPCYLPGYERYTLADFSKQERDMVFVGPERVNLFDYLLEKRRHRDDCADCAYSIACPGYWMGSPELGAVS